MKFTYFLTLLFAHFFGPSLACTCKNYGDGTVNYAATKYACYVARGWFIESGPDCMASSISNRLSKFARACRIGKNKTHTDCWCPLGCTDAGTSGEYSEEFYNAQDDQDDAEGDGI